MKIRSDFVTNSSSSSFILGFKKGVGIEKTLSPFKYEMMNANWVKISDSDYEQLVKDCHENVISKEEFLKKLDTDVEFKEELMDDFMDMAYHKLWYSLIDKTDSEEEALMKEQAEKFYQSFLNDLDGVESVVCLTYSDHDNNLEYALRRKPFTLSWFSHH